MDKMQFLKKISDVVVRRNCSMTISIDFYCDMNLVSYSVVCDGDAAIHDKTRHPTLNPVKFSLLERLSMPARSHNRKVEIEEVDVRPAIFFIIFFCSLLACRINLWRGQALKA